MTARLAFALFSARSVVGDVVSQTNYLLDALGRPYQATNADGTTTYLWGTRPHAPDKLAQTVSPDGVVHDRFYDSRGRLETETWTVAGESFSVHSHRDAFGRTDRIDYPVVQGVAPLSVSYAFNAFGALESVGRTGGPETFWKTIAENEDGAPTSAVYGNGITATRGYNPTTGQLIDAVDGQLLSLHYTYDEKGLAKSRTDGIGHRTEDYGYDALDRLTSFTVSDAKSVVSTFAYGYDDFGNMISEQQGGKPKATFGFGQNGAGPHELTSGPAGAYTYDSRGRVKTEPDAAFTFTEFDLPKTITPLKAGTAPKAQPPTELQYDAEHTRVLQSGPAGYTLRIAGLYERREPAGKRPNPDKAVHIFYVVGPEGVVAQITASPHGPLPTFGEVAYVHHDRLGSTSVVSDAKGKAQPALYYQPFGARSNFKGEAVGPPKTDVLLGFDGLRHDDDLGLIDQRGRVYEPATHRFLTPDPLVGQPLDSQSWNPYAFVRNSPVNRVDPSGFTDGADVESWFENIGSAVAGFFGSLFSGGGGSGGGGAGGSSHGSAHSTPHFTQVPQAWYTPGKSVLPTMPQGAPPVSLKPAWSGGIVGSTSAPSAPRESVGSTNVPLPGAEGGFRTAWQAAFAALTRYNPRSVQSGDPSDRSSTGTEYGGLIYKIGDRFFFSEAVMGEREGEVDVWNAMSSVPDGARRSIVGDYHTHGAPNPALSGEDFSGVHADPIGSVLPTLLRTGDLAEARSDLDSHRGTILNRDGYTAFLATPSGRFAVFIPGQNILFSFSPDARLLPAGATIAAGSYAH